MKPSLGFILTFLMAANWATVIILTRVTLSAGENPYNLTFWTALLALPFWLLIAKKEHSNITRLTKHDVLIITGMALISSVPVNFLEVLALKYSPAVNYSFLFRSVTAFTIVFAYFFLGEPVTKKKLVLLVLLLGGSFLLTTKGRGIQFTSGDLFTLAEAAVVAFGTNVLAKKATNRMHPDTAALGRYGISLLPILIIATLNTTPRLPLHWPVVMIITVLNVVFLQTMFRAFKHATATYVTMMMTFTPVLVSVFAIPFLGETLEPAQLIGGGFIVLAGIFVEKLKI